MRSTACTYNSSSAWQVDVDCQVTVNSSILTFTLHFVWLWACYAYFLLNYSILRRNPVGFIEQIWLKKIIKHFGVAICQNRSPKSFSTNCFYRLVYFGFSDAVNIRNIVVIKQLNAFYLSLQAGPLEKVRIPKDRDGRQKNFAFVTYCHEVSVPYAINLFRGTSLFHRTLSLQCRGRMPLLPPPIRCYGPEPPIEFAPQINIAKQFSDMTENLKEDDLRTVHMIRQAPELPDRLVIASLQGNWTHRHHPYRPKDKPHRDDYRPRDPREQHNDIYKGNNRNKHSNSNNWRDRRNHKKGREYHR